jgi:hypothetical protein
MLLEVLLPAVNTIIHGSPNATTKIPNLIALIGNTILK